METILALAGLCFGQLIRSHGHGCISVSIGADSVRLYYARFAVIKRAELARLSPKISVSKIEVEFGADLSVSGCLSGRGFVCCGPLGTIPIGGRFVDLTR